MSPLCPTPSRRGSPPADTGNYAVVPNIDVPVTVYRADGGSLAETTLTQKHTNTGDHTYTPDWGGLPTGQSWTFSSEASTVLSRQDFAADGSRLTYAIAGGSVGDVITVTLKASCGNYEDFTITLRITLTEKDDQAALRVTGGTTVVYGETLQLGTSGESILSEGGDLESLAKTFGKLTTCDSFLKCFTELGGGAVDAVIVDKPVATSYAQENAGFTILDEELGAEQYGIAFRSGDQELGDAIEGAVQQLVENGTYAKIAAKYPDIVNNLTYLNK